MATARQEEASTGAMATVAGDIWILPATFQLVKSTIQTPNFVPPGIVMVNHYQKQGWSFRKNKD